MEYVKICPSCGLVNRFDALVCENDAGSLLTVGMSAKCSDQVEPTGSHVVAPDTPAPSAGRRCPECKAPNIVGAIICEICASRLAPETPATALTWMIEWPWGIVPLPDYLAIGRDRSFSEVAAQLRAFPNVSGQHAEIRRNGGGFSIRDLGSMNGTFVDDVAIPPQQDMPLRGASTLRFARHLTARIVVPR